MQSLVLVCCLVALRDWKVGVLLFISIGFLQDPVRKIVPGQPGYFVVLAAVVFVAVVFSQMLRGYRFAPDDVPGWGGRVTRVIFAFFIVLALQLITVYINLQSLGIVAIGILGYVAPLMAILSGFYFASRSGYAGVDRMMKFYLGWCVLFSAGIYIEYLGFDYPVLGEVGSGLLIYDIGAVFDPYSGLFRATEVAAWHIAVGTALMAIFAVRSPTNLRRMLWILGIIFLVAAGVLTGRRKVIVSMLIFGLTYWVFLLVMLRRSLRIAGVVCLVGALSVWAATSSDLTRESGEGEFGLYVDRTSGVFGDVSSRAQSLGFATVVTAIKEKGILGVGAGAYSQGSRFVGSRGAGFAWQSEGGFGRVVLELGLFGLIVIIWLFIVLMGYGWRMLRYLALRSTADFYTAAGLVSLLVANVAHFFVASQVFGDPFILIMLGLVSGIIVASPVMARQRFNSEALPVRPDVVTV